MKFSRVLLCVIAGVSISGGVVCGQGPVVIKEVVSREVGIHVGGVQTPEIKEVVSREVGIFVGQDPPYQQVFSREYSLVLADPTPPPAIVEIAVSNSPSGDSVTLDWSSYNQWAVRDVEHYAVYYSTTAFTDISALGSPFDQPYAIIPGEQLVATFDGLPEFQDHFFAVVPVDALGIADPAVNYAGVYILMPQVVSRELGLFVGAEPVPPYPTVTSRELSLVTVDSSPPPRIEDFAVTVSPSGSRVDLDWSNYNQFEVRDVSHYEVYYSSSPIFDVTGMPVFATVGGENFTATLTGLAEFQDHYFAIVPVDGLGNRDPVVVYSAGYVLMPQVVSREMGLFVGAEPAPPYRHSISREVSLLLSGPDVPAPVTGVDSSFAAMTSTSQFGAVDLSWSGYNEAAQRDVVRYRIYVADAFFDDVTGMPFTSTAGENLRATIAGLEAERVYHFAVVAEDGLGNFDPVVYSRSAKTSVGRLGDVADLGAIPRKSEIEYFWDLGGVGEELANFVGHFLLTIDIDGVETEVVVPASERRWTVTGLTPDTEYFMRLRVVDLFGMLGDLGVSITARTLPYDPGEVLPGFPVFAFDAFPDFDAIGRTVAMLPDGKVMMGGYFDQVGGVSVEGLVRLNPDSTVDTTFSGAPSGGVWSLDLTLPAHYRIGGNFTDGVDDEQVLGLALLDLNGVRDLSLPHAADHFVFGTQAMPDGGFLAWGLFGSIAGQPRTNIARFDASGGLDAFDPDISGGGVRSVALQPDGKLLLAGGFGSVGGQSRPKLVRLGADASVDASFAPPSLNDFARTVLVQPNGKVLVSGLFTNVAGTSVSRLARFNANGSHDPSFAVNANGTVFSLVAYANGDVLFGGDFTSVNGVGRNRIAKVDSTGQLLDLDVAANGSVLGFAQSEAGDIYVVGDFTSINGQPSAGFARLYDDPGWSDFRPVSTSEVIWHRGGNAVAVEQVEFEVSSDGGTSWSPLGAPIWDGVGWRLDGLALPSIGTLRARGITRSGYCANSYSWVVEEVDYVGAGGFADWIASFGLSGADAVPGADPNGDGVSNLLAWTWQITPVGSLASDLEPLPHVVAEGTTFGVEFSLPDPLPADGIRYVVEASATLGADDWTVVADMESDNGLWLGRSGGEVSVTTAEGNRTGVRVEGGLFEMDGTRFFLRARVEADN